MQRGLLRDVSGHRQLNCRVASSDDLEIALELPVGDVLPVLALLPFAGRRVVLDEGGAEELARRLRCPQPLRRVPQRRGERLVGGGGALVCVALDRRLRLELPLDAPEAGGERGG